MQDPHKVLIAIDGSERISAILYAARVFPPYLTQTLPGGHQIG
jgi:hypothetical protein